MSQYLVSEEQVKKALKIDSFRSIPKAKIMDFVSLIPNMDKEVAIAIINQFPTYAETAGNMITQLNLMCDNILKVVIVVTKKPINAYKKILDDLGEILKRENITEVERERITKNMIDIADRIAAKDTEEKKFLEKIYKYGVSVIGGTLILGAVILGVNVKGKQIPRLEDEDEDIEA